MAASKVQYIEHNQKRILYIDMSNCDLEEIVRIIKEAKSIIANAPPRSVLTLANLRGVHYHALVGKVAKDFTDFNKPYVKAGAVVGLNPALAAEFGEIQNFSGREIKVFDDPVQAKDWLISQ